MKKILLGAGALVAAIAPALVAASCGEKNTTPETNATPTPTATPETNTTPISDAKPIPNAVKEPSGGTWKNQLYLNLDKNGPSFLPFVYGQSIGTAIIRVINEWNTSHVGNEISISGITTTTWLTSDDAPVGALETFDLRNDYLIESQETKDSIALLLASEVQLLVDVLKASTKGSDLIHPTPILPDEFYQDIKSKINSLSENSIRALYLTLAPTPDYLLNN